MKYKQLVLGIIIGVVGSFSLQLFDNTYGKVKELYQEVKEIGVVIYHSDRTCDKFDGVLLGSETNKTEIRQRIKDGAYLCNKCITDKMIKWAEDDEE